MDERRETEQPEVSETDRIKFRIRNHNGYVIFEFDRPVTSLAFTPDDTVRLGRDLAKHARAIRKRKRGKK